VSRAWHVAEERGSLAAIGLLAWLTVRLGRRATRWLLQPICWYFLVTSARARRASRAFLARVLGRPPGIRDVMRHLHTFATTVHDRVLLVRGECAAFEIATQGERELASILDGGRGCILLGSHLGSFEVLRALGRFTGKYAVNAVIHERAAAKTSHVFSRLAPELRGRLIRPGQPDTMLKIKECLERGEPVGILADRPLGSARTLEREFLGTPARFPIGPLLLAGALGVPVVMFFGLYMGGARYEIHFERLTDGVFVPREHRVDQAGRWLNRYVDRLAHHARRAPYNWFNFYDFWATQETA
jgi:predicted LPLAT superfamily acyltransferase